MHIAVMLCLLILAWLIFFSLESCITVNRQTCRNHRPLPCRRVPYLSDPNPRAGNEFEKLLCVMLVNVALILATAPSP